MTESHKNNKLDLKKTNSYRIQFSKWNVLTYNSNIDLKNVLLLYINMYVYFKTV